MKTRKIMIITNIEGNFKAQDIANENMYRELFGKRLSILEIHSCEDGRIEISFECKVKDMKTIRQMINTQVKNGYKMRMGA